MKNKTKNKVSESVRFLQISLVCLLAFSSVVSSRYTYYTIV